MNLLFDLVDVFYTAEVFLVDGFNFFSHAAFYKHRSVTYVECLLCSYQCKRGIIVRTMMFIALIYGLQ